MDTITTPVAPMPTTGAGTMPHDYTGDMPKTGGLIGFNDLPCCPQLDMQPLCDIFDMRRRLLFPTGIFLPNDRNERRIQVEVTIHTRFSRCSGALTLGEIVYSNTLLPGEKVRLATTDRRSRFSFDSESKLSYRSESISEEQYRMSALRSFMADDNATDNGNNHASDEGKWDFHGDASGSIGFMSASADANAHGSHSGSSASDYLRQHRGHAESADKQSVEATRKAHSISVGEVSTRTHQQGESEDHFESSSREFANPNSCHAITFIFYRLNKLETVTFEIVAIERRVLDPAAPLPIPANPFARTGGLHTIPQEVPASGSQRVIALQRGIAAEEALKQANLGNQGNGLRGFVNTQTPISDAVRQAALDEVDKQLVAAGLLDKVGGTVSPKIREEINYSRKTALPTAGVVVKGCMDECNICEPEVNRKRMLELDHLELQNALLKKQIELLDKSQEYRCCPAGETAKV